MSLKFKNKALIKFYGNKAALVSLFFIIFLCFVSLFSYVIAPDNSPNANEQFPKLAQKPPLFSVKMLKIKKEDFTKTPFFKGFFNGFEKPYTLLPIDSASILDNNQVFIKEYEGGSYLLPSTDLYVENNNPIKLKRFLFGTDQLGRDIFSRMLIGSRVSILVGFFAVLISGFIGIVLGGFAGFYGKNVDKGILWLMSVFWSLPTVLLAMALFIGLKKYFENNIWLIFIAIGITMWVSMARMVRGQMKAFKEIQFVEAAGSLGFSDFRIIFRHILPNLLGPIVVVMASGFASAILIESGLSFLGLGVQAPAPSWGSMLAEFKDFIGTKLSYLALLPGIFIMLLVLSFNLLANGLRDALDIKN